MKCIVEMVFGSHLYGTDTPESDKDYKGVFMPARDDIPNPCCFLKQFSAHLYLPNAVIVQRPAVDMLPYGYLIP